MKYYPRPGPLYGSAPTPVEIFVVINLLSDDNRVFLVDTESAMGRGLERAAKAVAESNNYNIDWGFFTPARRSGKGYEMVEMSMREWIVAARIREATVLGISETRLMACVNFNIRRRGDTLII